MLEFALPLLRSLLEKRLENTLEANGSESIRNI